MADDTDEALPEDDVTEAGLVSVIECEHHILYFAGGIERFAEANHADLLRVNRKTADIELADKETRRYRDFGKADRASPLRSILTKPD